MALNEASIPALLAEKNEAAFEQVFKSHFKDLHRYATALVKDAGDAEEMVQNVFMRLWEKATQLNYHTGLQAYLYRAVHNECLNHLQRQKTRQTHEKYLQHTLKGQGDSAAKKLLHANLQHKFSEALDDLPQQCRTIFQLSRTEELKYQEIADRMGLSIKTVEAQMGKALRILRQKLIDFLPAIIVTLSQLLNFIK